jgi:hypothetical protein
MRRDKKIASMLDRARELAARGQNPIMIEAVLAANGFPEAAEWIGQPHIHNELKNIGGRKQSVSRRKTGTMGLEFGNEPIRFSIGEGDRAVANALYRTCFNRGRNWAHIPRSNGRNGHQAVRNLDSIN